VGVRGRIMVSLAAVSGACIWGCMQTSLPPAPLPSAAPAPLGPQVGSVPGTAPSFKLPANLPLNSLPSKPVAISNPWKPTVAAREWNSIVIHHTATTRGDVASIHDSHLKNKDGSGKAWLGIGYHFVIGNGNGMGDGEIEPTFRWREQMHGAHAGNQEHNQHGIGIAMIGDFNEGPPSPAQLSAIKRLVGVLKAEYGIGSDQVIGHSDIKATDCPGKHFPMAEVSHGTPHILWGAAEPPRQAGPPHYRAAPLEPVKLARQEGNRNR
jgi:N-acetyl-anhydromuramyl-L-alanine amidase AmpD